VSSKMSLAGGSSRATQFTSVVHVTATDRATLVVLIDLSFFSWSVVPLFALSAQSPVIGSPDGQGYPCDFRDVT
jgi:hypothetical protein